MKPKRNQFSETDSLQKMGKALGWRRETQETWYPLPKGSHALRVDKDGDVTDEVIDVGGGHVYKPGTDGEIKK